MRTEEQYNIVRSAPAKIKKNNILLYTCKLFDKVDASLAKINKIFYAMIQICLSCSGLVFFFFCFTTCFFPSFTCISVKRNMYCFKTLHVEKNLPYSLYRKKKCFNVIKLIRQCVTRLYLYPFPSVVHMNLISYATSII